MTFSEDRHGPVKWFGRFVEEGRHAQLCREAVAALEAACERCTEEDLRADEEVTAALAYLARAVPSAPCGRFRQALAFMPQEARRMVATAALDAIRCRLPAEG